MPVVRTPTQLVVNVTRTTGGSLLAQASTPVTATGATATVTAQGESSGATGVLGTGIVVAGDTAIVLLTSNPATVVLGDTDDIVIGDATTATVNVTANGGVALVGSFSPGDPWQAPTVRSAASGSNTWSTATYTTQTDEPASSGTYYRSRWFKFTNATGELSFTATGSGGDMRVDAFEVGANLSDPTAWGLINYAAGGSATLSYIFPDATYGIYVRVSAQTDTTFDLTLDWETLVFPNTDDPGGNGPVLQVYDPIIEVAPGSVTFAIFNLIEDEEVELRVIPNPLAFTTLTATADDAGTILGESFELPGDLPAGTYTLAADHGNGTATDTFVIASEPVLNPEADPSDDDSALDDPPPAGPFTKWTFVDPAGIKDDFVFTYNPYSMTSPYVPRTFLSDTTTAPTGQAQVWEALSPGASWEFSGYLDTEDELDELISWVRVKRRFWCIDHRQRKWVITLVSIDPQPKRVINTPYAHMYTVRALLFKQGEE